MNKNETTENKNTYEEPKLEVIEMEKEDIICASNGYPDGASLE